MTWVPAGYGYRFYRALPTTMVLVFVVIWAVRIEQLSGAVLIALLVACVLVLTGVLVRLSRCGLRVSGTVCEITTLFGTETVRLLGARLGPRRVSFAAKVDGLPSVTLEDGTEVIFHVLAGASEGRLWDVEQTLLDSMGT